MEGVIYFVGCLEFVLFFVADFYIAYTLNRLKQDHPAIDDCAPLDDDTAVAVDVDAHGAAQSNAYSAASMIAASVTGTPLASGNRLHTAVVILSVAAPFLMFFQIVAPLSMDWSMWSVPSFLSYLVTIPGLGLAIFYGLRALRVAEIGDTVTKSVWLSVMWFRLDVVCAMATVMLLGWGDWLVAGCLYAMDLYLAQRLLATERRLVRATRGTQLLKEDLDEREEIARSYDNGATASSRGPVQAIVRSAAGL
jgi:hypothetical protein